MVGKYFKNVLIFFTTVGNGKHEDKINHGKSAYPH